MPTTIQANDLRSTSSVQPAAKSRIGLIVALSLAAGLVAAAVLVAMPFIPAKENVLTGVVLLGFGLGWALLAVLSVRFSDQPQRWAAAPAVFMAVAGPASLSGSAAVQTVFSWVWPPALFALVVWMFLRARRQLRSRIARWLLYPVLAVLMIASIGGGVETVGESVDARAYPLPGRLIDVGGHRLHLHCTGSGSPTVLLEPGGGAGSSDLGWIAPAVARDTTVCVYDRAGRGWSDAADGPQDGAHIAADLHTLLNRAHVPGPYVLAGHSFGGLYVQSFAAQFPDQVAGMVLLDSTAPKPVRAFQTNSGTYDVIRRGSALVSALAHLGLGRLIAQGSYDTLPPRSRDEARANSSTAKHLDSFFEEFLGYADASMQQASALTDLNGKPLIVLTADEGNNDNQWQSKQNQLATLSTNSLHRHATASHDSLISDQTDSAAASQAIHDVVTAVRTSHPLAQP
ncbi:alpha/beta fold hydrolase [Microlunatus sp. Gsoil 973]|uniref:alpha/beta fold hydrolase n=1 Tax=Microlunatus sp. Gsoil 973 TaxID=2672569 RepID=UPI0012B4D4D1|nr:alpha/beta fold hydrolase [Microlunatus sp. Gsoil 973]QGN34453.1 alpha/beta fold hydrolase [Microlunatus sp. Gsoil 973]